MVAPSEAKDRSVPPMDNPRGSLWHRWDPHIHPPGTVLNDQYGGADPWDEFLSRIAAAKLAEFKALSYGQKDTAIKKFVADEKLATMLKEDVPAPGAIDKCADAISDLSR